jgi:hypothetical protein
VADVVPDSNEQSVNYGTETNPMTTPKSMMATPHKLSQLPTPGYTGP